MIAYKTKTRAELLGSRVMLPLAIHPDHLSVHLLMSAVWGDVPEKTCLFRVQYHSRRMGTGGKTLREKLRTTRLRTYLARKRGTLL
jgi:hypothetical protein